MKVEAIVTDIEGTTSNIEFVHNVLFPYSKEHLPAFVEAHWEDPGIRTYLQQVETQTGAEGVEAVVQQLIQWVEQDVKATPLKALQGKIWQQGFAEGRFRSHIYADAFDAITAWHQAGLPVYVFSSGSVDAQIGIFGHTEQGDLTPCLSGYFDTEVGAKREVDAYRHITESVGRQAAAILFLSDVVPELDAAAAAGMQTCLLVRGAVPEGADRHPAVEHFGQLASVFEF